MPPEISHSEIFRSHSENETSTVTFVAAVVCLIWYVAVALVCIVGYTQMYVIITQRIRVTVDSNITQMAILFTTTAISKLVILERSTCYNYSAYQRA